MLRFIIPAAMFILIVAGCAPSPSSPSFPSGWSATRTSDPVTGQSRCVVAHYDHVRGDRYTRTAFLYPIVEQNPEYGLLVGVSTGGPVRIPLGDILWRVDGNPHTRIAAADTPLDEQGKALMDQARAGSLNEQHAAAMEQAMRTTAGLISANTLAAGDRARALLDEMLRGRSLIFRAAAADPGMGLPTGGSQSVGIIQGGQQIPIPLDASFKQAIRQCGIR